MYPYPITLDWLTPRIFQQKHYAAAGLPSQFAELIQFCDFNLILQFDNFVKMEGQQQTS
jgi:hypothetical protein